jgi:hypothetical protein
MAWDTYAICPGCNEKYRAPFGDAIHIHFAVCPNCGERKSDRWIEGWNVRTLRFVEPFRLFQRNTWKLDSYWEARDGKPVLETSTPADRNQGERI